MHYSIFDLVHWPHRGEPWGGLRQTQIYREHMEEWLYAEELGFDAIWLTEHHFTAYNMLPSPNLMLAALAQATTRIKVGAMINAVNFHNPWRLAEEAAMLDVLSGGRLLLGMGRGADVQEYAKYQQPMAEGRPRFREGLELIKRAFTEETVHFAGQFYTIDGAALMPRPVQQPYPPIYLTAVSPETFVWAGQEGYPIASVFLTPERTAQVRASYQAERERAGNPMAPGDFLLARHIYVAETREQAIAEARLPVLEFFRLFKDAALPATVEELDSFPENFRHYTEHWRPLFGEDVSYESLIERGVLIVGDAESVAAEITRQREIIGFDHLMCQLAFGHLTHEQVMRSMRLLGEQVMPAVR
jgi:alkanesulfonate monooxygenase SsuD/methylene tetrahydromethanopterin reductase-like flavin-dependent oxidoreductase (luciferase family)